MLHTSAPRTCSTYAACWLRMPVALRVCCSELGADRRRRSSRDSMPRLGYPPVFVWSLHLNCCSLDAPNIALLPVKPS